MIRSFQNANMLLRYASVPVVGAPAGIALAGGCEVLLHADRIQAAAETYIGLVEVGVGLDARRGRHQGDDGAGVRGGVADDVPAAADRSRRSRTSAWARWRRAPPTRGG